MTYSTAREIPRLKVLPDMRLAKKSLEKQKGVGSPINSQKARTIVLLRMNRLEIAGQ